MTDPTPQEVNPTPDSSSGSALRPTTEDAMVDPQAFLELRGASEDIPSLEGTELTFSFRFELEELEKRIRRLVGERDKAVADLAELTTDMPNTAEGGELYSAQRAALCCLLDHVDHFARNKHVLPFVDTGEPSGLIRGVENEYDGSSASAYLLVDKIVDSITKEGE